MAQGRPSRGESVTENLQDYIEESIQNSTDLPDTGATRDQNRSASGMSQGQTDQPASSMPTISPNTEAALEEHLTATETVRGVGQNDTANAGAADLQSAAAQQEARGRMTDPANNDLGMGNLRR